MVDLVIKGTGNSRFLKTSVAEGTTWADALFMLRSGTFPVDFNGFNSAGITTPGTELNKENLLSDETVAALGLTGGATPDDALNAILKKANITSGTSAPTGGNDGDIYIQYV